MADRQLEQAQDIFGSLIADDRRIQQGWQDQRLFTQEIDDCVFADMAPVFRAWSKS